MNSLFVKILDLKFDCISLKKKVLYNYTDKDE